MTGLKNLDMGKPTVFTFFHDDESFRDFVPKNFIQRLSDRKRSFPRTHYIDMFEFAKLKDFVSNMQFIAFD